MSSSTDRGLEEQLMEAGNRLNPPPSSAKELLPVLDQVENFLTRVQQSPPKSMQNALFSSQKALVSSELLRHSDVDVKVAVASCISEITRITAPEAPYDDEQMKEIFQLIVSSFEELSDMSSRSYNKRTLILETVAKVRSCVVMLDLECDTLIIEMFQNFLKSIRDNHSGNVFTSMETIMILVLEESEDISVELLTPMLASLKKDTKEFLPIAQKLAKNVFENCATKLKPHLIHAVKSLGIFLEDYNEVVSSICLEKPDSVELHNENNSCKNQADEGTLATLSSEKAPEVDGGTAAEVACLEEVDTAEDISSKAVPSSGTTGTQAVLGSGVPQEVDDVPILESKDQSKSVDTSSKSKSGDGLDTGKIAACSEANNETTSKKRGRKPSCTLNSTKPSVSSPADSDKEAESLRTQMKIHKEGHSSPREDSSHEAGSPSGQEKGTDVQPLVPKAGDGETLSPSGTLPDQNRPRKGGRPKKRESSIREAKTPPGVPKRASEGTSDSGVRRQKRSGKKANSGGKAPIAAQKIKKENNLGNSELRPLKEPGKKMDSTNSNEDGPSTKQQQERKGQVRGKASVEKDGKKSSADNDGMEITPTPKPALKSTEGKPLSEAVSKAQKRKWASGQKEPVSKVLEFGEDLVGSKIKVLWPEDDEYYEGVVGSFDPVEKKHKVLYTDGDLEVLNLKDEKWKLVEEKSGEQEVDHPSSNASSKKPRKKKAKASSDFSAEESCMDLSAKRGAASSSKGKGKPGRKSRNDSIKDYVAIGKSKSRTPKSGSKKLGDATKTTRKSKDNNVDTPKSAIKSSQDSLKSVSKSKGRIMKSGGKSNASGAGKMKSGSSVVKTEDEAEDSDLDEKTPDSGKAFGSEKGKLSNSSKARDSEGKTPKKKRKV